jgi:hypothetical protein
MRLVAVVEQALLALHLYQELATVVREAMALLQPLAVLLQPIAEEVGAAAQLPQRLVVRVVVVLVARVLQVLQMEQPIQVVAVAVAVIWECQNMVVMAVLA